MSKFIITIRKNGEFQFNLKADNGQTILNSEGYITKANCENGIVSVRINSTDENKFDSKMATNGKSYFNLRATNGQIIGTSEMYESEVARNNGIESVKNNALNATVEDQTING